MKLTENPSYVRFVCFRMDFRPTYKGKNIKDLMTGKVVIKIWDPILQIDPV